MVGLANHSWFFTAPSEPLYLRRGDALGFRIVSDRYAEILAPGLSSRTHDARWISVLSWILVRAKEAWDRYEPGHPPPASSRETASKFYEWMRPLELLWIARALALQEDEPGAPRQLPGRRAVKQWLAAASRGSLSSVLTPGQRGRYRAIGPYGMYRVIFRSASGLTNGDGFTVDAVARALAEEIESTVLAPSLPLGAARGRKPLPDDFWQARWDFAAKRRGVAPLLPLRRGTTDRLPSSEAREIRKALFADASPSGLRRSAVVRLCVRGPSDHAALCRYLAERSVKITNDRIEQHLMETLPYFATLADAGMNAMRAVWRVVGKREAAPILPADEVCGDDEVKETLAELSNVADSARRRLPSGNSAWEAPRNLAETLATARQPGKRFLALARHHAVYGGGRKWFRMDGSDVVRQAKPSADAADYRFRLTPLARLAWQSRAIDVQPGILSDSAEDREEEAENLDADADGFE